MFRRQILIGNTWAFIYTWKSTQWCCVNDQPVLFNDLFIQVIFFEAEFFALRAQRVLSLRIFEV